mmetsp:Transcript_17101/g.39550  ORF Transcript_17101/g.39550 Transcript_17101/m.39550 type:complete len:120 (+) Transcript_17101:1-360(+)|eukprot:CAMPEP_0116832782 /NCGR_PEP_ID=MMETSP0418-20121206/6080_1 /TAXON_ID=1158023 /ORGANISM="Astrosyne radiata, Strain 13vi08-1A" /LENGTH=119 /DNA_ID=CAMNT_0004462175 /DNA_START=342 /DNA_END=701 /DNA_ORIENTATION=+
MTGIMIRTGLEADQSHLSIAFKSNGKLEWNNRMGRGQPSQRKNRIDAVTPLWMKLERTLDPATGHSVYAAFGRKLDSDPWTLIRSVTIQRNVGQLHVGFFVASNDPHRSAEVYYSNFIL